MKARNRVEHIGININIYTNKQNKHIYTSLQGILSGSTDTCNRLEAMLFSKNYNQKNQLKKIKKKFKYLLFSWI